MIVYSPNKAKRWILDGTVLFFPVGCRVGYPDPAHHMQAQCELNTLWGLSSVLSFSGMTITRSQQAGMYSAAERPLRQCQG